MASDRVLNMYRTESFVAPTLSLFAEEFYLAAPVTPVDATDDAYAIADNDALSGSNVIQL